MNLRKFRYPVSNNHMLIAGGAVVTSWFRTLLFLSMISLKTFSENSMASFAAQIKPTVSLSIQPWSVVEIWPRGPSSPPPDRPCENRS